SGATILRPIALMRGQVPGQVDTAMAARLNWPGHLTRWSRAPVVGLWCWREADRHPSEETMSTPVHVIARFLGAIALGLSLGVSAQQPITLHGAVQFDDNHPFNKSLLKFEELVKKYYGKPVNFVLHRNSELGLEKDYFAYMSQGISVDY